MGLPQGRLCRQPADDAQGGEAPSRHRLFWQRVRWYACTSCNDTSSSTAAAPWPTRKHKGSPPSEGLAPNRQPLIRTWDIRTSGLFRHRSRHAGTLSHSPATRLTPPPKRGVGRPFTGTSFGGQQHSTASGSIGSKAENRRQPLALRCLLCSPLGPRLMVSRSRGTIELKRWVYLRSSDGVLFSNAGQAGPLERGHPCCCSQPGSLPMHPPTHFTSLPRGRGLRQAQGEAQGPGLLLHTVGGGPCWLGGGAGWPAGAWGAADVGSGAALNPAQAPSPSHQVREGVSVGARWGRSHPEAHHAR